eukprot:CAMPEP_0177200220 /NCGR_PEP_ID=MMETSP0367-20130122/26103_1 /TAXON_ID=447022 ORGANISM="Scrippsiella hangoei-like, Strain SHHI-4" /NCGR_SAMPLE_ID=MMETSP0367 /ASSEMBLY_ACC=CAM_ASM_000362 /LENGTH=246 /DNA_ID=CAMNT_0018648645 /DNA_START=143 /DNA_END=884 /DNA_ORIENTATION=+
MHKLRFMLENSWLNPAQGQLQDLHRLDLLHDPGCGAQATVHRQDDVSILDPEVLGVRDAIDADDEVARPHDVRGSAAASTAVRAAGEGADAAAVVVPLHRPGPDAHDLHSFQLDVQGHAQNVLILAQAHPEFVRLLPRWSNLQARSGRYCRKGTPLQGVRLLLLAGINRFSKQPLFKQAALQTWLRLQQAAAALEDLPPRLAHNLDDVLEHLDCLPRLMAAGAAEAEHGPASSPACNCGKPPGHYF